MRKNTMIYSILLLLLLAGLLLTGFAGTKTAVVPAPVAAPAALAAAPPLPGSPLQPIALQSNCPLTV